MVYFVQFTIYQKIPTTDIEIEVHCSLKTKINPKNIMLWWAYLTFTGMAVTLKLVTYLSISVDQSDSVFRLIHQ